MTKNLLQKISLPTLFVCLVALFSSSSGLSQNAIVGTGFSTGWGGSCNAGSSGFTYFSDIASGSYGAVLSPNGTGDQFWRFGIDWGGTFAQRTITPGSDTAVSPGTTYTLSSTCTSSGALKYNVPNTTYKYVFKTLNAGSNPTGQFVFFEVQGAVRTVSSVTRNPSTTPFVNSAVTVTANLSGALATGQGVYLRYTNNSYSTSTVTQMTGSGTTYTATIPAGTNTQGATVSYYVFTSGTANVAANGSNADLYTINLNNNSGANYTYAPALPPTYGSITSNGAACNGGTLSFSITGLRPSSSNTINYNVNGGSNNAATVTSDASGNATLTRTAAIAENGQTLTVTSVQWNSLTLPVSASNTATIQVNASTTYYADNDGDGYGNAASSIQACSPQIGYVTNNTDCNDNNGQLYISSSIYVDADADNYDNGSLVICHGTAEPNGFSFITNGSDCNDNNASVYQSASLYTDADADGYNAGTETVCYGATIPSGHSTTTSGTDCNDANAAVYQSALLYVDEDGDGFNNGNSEIVCYGATVPPGYTATDVDIDCDDAMLLYVDNDGDGYGSDTYAACDGVENSDDCNDNNASIGAGSNTYYADADSDGFGNPSVTTTGCTLPAGYVTNSLDCNDSLTLYQDADADGFGSNVKVACNGVANHTDCNDNQTLYQDSDADGFGSTIKVACNGVTNSSDCNDSQLQYADADGDGFGSNVKVACGLTNNSDCNDNQLQYADADADGFGSNVKVACGVTNNSDCNDNQIQYLDADGDTFGSTTPVACGVTNSSDCNDNQLQYADADGDGFGSNVKVACGLTNNSDCNDNQIQYLDADGDGFGSTTHVACGVTNSSDCNDGQLQYADLDGDGFGSNTQVACGVSNNSDCNDNQLQYLDADADGFGSLTQVACGVTNFADCDDNQLQYADIDGDGFGSNTPVACGVTNNSDCNDSQIQYLDADNDGFGSTTQVACGVASSNDCNDNQSQYQDLDGDGFGSNVKVACGVTNNSDCNDSQIQYLDADGDSFGGDVQVACGVVNSDDCDDNQLQYADADADGFGSNTQVACGVTNNSDCNDSQIQYLDADGDSFGGDVQVACGVVNSDDCDDNQLQYADADGDGFGSNTQVACGVANNSDCNDSQLLYSDADDDGLGSDTLVACSGVTNSDDCNDNDATNATLHTYYQDADGDSYGNPAVSQTSCTPVAGYVLNNTDCNDGNAAIYQSATLYADADGDGYTNGTSSAVCYGNTVPAGYTASNIGIDCNDNNANVYHSAQLYVDFDGDGYNNGTTQSVCYGATIPVGYTLANGGLDCNDALASVHPGAAEVLGNGIDDDCNGQTDEGGPQVFTQILPSQCGTTLAAISSLIAATSKPNITAYRFRVTNVATNQTQTIVRTAPHFQLTSLATYDYAATYAIDIELQVSGNWVGAYGPVCNVSTPAILDEGGSASVTPSQCGVTLPALSTLISTTSLNSVTGYRFRVTNTLTNEVQVIDRTLQWFSLTMLASYNYGTTYAIEVAVKTTGAYSGYGSPCFVSTPDVPTLVNCDSVAATPSTNVNTYSLNRVTSYRFELTNLNDFTQTVVDRTHQWFNFNNIPNYVPGALYAVRVALKTAGSWSPYGEACLVTAPGASRNIVKDEPEAQPEITFRAVVYPNPYSESFALDMDTPGEGNVTVKVYDMIGKLVEQREFAIDEIETQQFGERYPSGVYNLVIAQDGFVKTLRIIKR